MTNEQEVLAEVQKIRDFLNQVDPHEHYEGMNECAICDESLSASMIRVFQAIRDQEAAKHRADVADRAEILRPGEAYAGIILGKDGEPDYHLVLIPGATAGVTWYQAKEWAAKSGGELPTRREQSLLFANLKEHFEPYYHWSCEQHESISGYAWGQYFVDGGQTFWSKNYLRDRAVSRARAVRRVAI